jgi:hypothetical protein
MPIDYSGVSRDLIWMNFRWELPSWTVGTWFLYAVAEEGIGLLESRFITVLYCAV